MLSLLSTVALLSASVLAAPPAPQWRFDLKNQTTGIVALEAIIVSPTLVVMFDRVSNDPLQINNHSAWGALWDLETSSVRPLNVITNSFCASGSLLSNGTMVCAYPSRMMYNLYGVPYYRSVLAAIQPISRETQSLRLVILASVFSSRAHHHLAKDARSSKIPQHCIWPPDVGTRHRSASSTAA
jgi:hypothetical protein